MYRKDMYASATVRSALLFGFILMSAEDSFALDLSVLPQVRIATRATDNVRWSSFQRDAALGFDNGGSLEFKADSDYWKSKINPSVNIRRFGIGENLDAEEYGVRSQHQWLATERITLGANLDYVRDSTLTTELTDAGAQNQVANRSAVTIQPNVTLLLNDRNSLNGSYLFNDVQFDTDANGQLVDYRYEQFSVGATHIWQHNVRLFLNGFASQFETQIPEGQTRTYGTQGGVEYLYRPDLGATVSVGYVKSDIEFDTQFLALDPGPPARLVVATRTDKVSTNGPIAAVSLFKDFSYTRTRFDYNRRVSPSIRGSQQLEDDIQVTAEHDLTKRWSFGLRGGYNLRSSELQNISGIANQTSSTQLNRNQAAVSGWMQYWISKRMSIRTEYRFARNSFDETLQRNSVYNNALFVSFIFKGEPHVLRGY